MLSEIKLAEQRKFMASEKRSEYKNLASLSFPRNSIVKLNLSKADKPTIEGSRKLLPDVQNFYQVLRSGPTSCQLRNISDNTIRTHKKSALTLVNFQESQEALQLMKDNFPKSLLWEYNAPHRKQSTPRYLQHLTAKVTKVKFNPQVQILCLDKLIELENDFLLRYHTFSEFPDFLRKNSILPVTFEDIRSENQNFSYPTVFQFLVSCPCTSVKELNLLFN